MKTSEIRQSFLDFFNSKDHEVVSSSSLVPNNDETQKEWTSQMDQWFWESLEK